MKIQNAYFIIWNSAKKNFNNICDDIEKETIIRSKKIIEIKNYYDLICDLYMFNNQRELGKYKATKMCDNSKYEIMILEVEFCSKVIDDFSLVKSLKKDIRNLYKFTTDNYFHDNIIHGTDSLKEYEYIKKIVGNINNYQ